MEIWNIPVVFTVGIIAGLINTLAGGGSLLSLPILIFLGLPAAVANGTNRLAIMIQCIFAVAGFKRKGVSDFKLSILLSIPALFGAVIGAQIAIDIPDSVFKMALAVVMMFVLGLILWNPHRREQPVPSLDASAGAVAGRGVAGLSKVRLTIMMVVFFFIGVYGGFIQAGVGFIIIAAFTAIGGFGLVKTNSHKVFIVGVYTLFALLVFVFNDKIFWSLGLSLAAGNGLGGWLGSHLAVAKGEKWLRIFLIISVIVMVVKLFGLIPF